MAVIKSNCDVPLPIPGGPMLNPDRKMRVEKWHIVKHHPTVKAWLSAKAIEEVVSPAFHPLDHDRDGRKGGSEKQEPKERLTELRAEYQDVLGKRPFHGWSEDELMDKITEAKLV